MKRVKTSENINKKITTITYIVDFLRSPYGGTERQLGHLLTHLPYAGYSLQLISFQNSPFLKNEAPRLFPKVVIKTLGGQSDVSKSLPALVSLFSYLRINKPDIVHTFFPASNSFGVLISRLAGIRTVISSRRDLGFNITKKDIVFLKIANRFVSCIVTNAGAVQEHVIKVEGIKRKKTRVIYNGISFDGYNLSSHTNVQKEPVIGIVANLNRPVKRVDLFIKAAAIINKELPDVRFWVIGDGPLRGELEEFASSLGLNGNIHFFGRREDVNDLIQHINVGVLCSDSEGLSNAIMEFMGNGIPVVATNVGGNGELIEHEETGLLVPKNDIDLLVKSIKRCIQNANLSQRIAQAGKAKIIDTFSMERMINETESLYLNLAHRAAKHKKVYTYSF